MNGLEATKIRRGANQHGANQPSKQQIVILVVNGGNRTTIGRNAGPRRPLLHQSADKATTTTTEDAENDAGNAAKKGEVPQRARSMEMLLGKRKDEMQHGSAAAAGYLQQQGVVIGHLQQQGVVRRVRATNA